MATAAPPAAAAAAMPINQIHLDEEDVLGCEVFVAELELLAGARASRPDQARLLELLQKLLPSLAAADVSVVRRCQKRCEAALADLLRRGLSPVVRGLACGAMSALFSAGDVLPLYGRVSTLQAELQERDKGPAGEPARLAALELLARLSAAHGGCLGSSSLETIGIAAKTVAKGSSPALRLAGMRLAVAVVEGLNPLDRNAGPVHAEAWRLLDKAIKDKASEEQRAEGAALAAALARAGGPALWSNAGAGWEEAVRACISGLDDCSPAVRGAAGAALAELAACPRSPELGLTAALDAEKKPPRRTQLEKVAAGAFKAALVTPFVEAAVAGRKEACVALASAWVSYSLSLLSRGKLDEDGLVDLGVTAVTTLEACSKTEAAAAAAAAGAKGAAVPEPELGACLSGGEMPHAQACIAYVLRAAVTRQLPEAGQRKLLDRLVGAAAGGIAPPLVIAALEGAGALIEVLGEVDGEAAAAVEQVISSKITAPSAAVRNQAASVLAALSLACPPLMARLLGSYLEAVESGAQTLQMLAAPYSKPGVVGSSKLGPGTPRAAPDSQSRHAVDALHGAALAVGALLVASARSALGVPSRLPRSAFWIAKRMILQPYCSAHWAAAAERDAGYLLLGALCAGGASPDVLVGLSQASLKRGAGGDALALFRVALGPGAREALDESTYAGRPGAEGEFAVALWWRASALQALTAYALGVVSKGLVADPEGEITAISEMLAPLLEALASQPLLSDPTRALSAAGPGAAPSPANGSAGAGAAGGALATHPHVAAAAATLQLRLLEAFFFLPGAHLAAGCHGALLKLCCQQLQGFGGSKVSPDAAAAVAAASLRHMLHPGDSLLGPWLPGREQLEDELRAFVGGRGGPQQHPWEAGLAFTAGFLGQTDTPLAGGETEQQEDQQAGGGAVPSASSTAENGGGGRALLHAPWLSSFGVGAAGGGSEGIGGAAGPSAATPRGPSGPGGAAHAHAGAFVAGAGRRRAADGVRAHRRFLPLPQPCGLGAALLEVQLWTLGKLLAVIPEPAQVQVLEIMAAAASPKPHLAAKKEPSQARARGAATEAALVAALAGLGPLARRARAGGGVGGSGGDDRLAERVLGLALAILEDRAWPDPLAARGAAEVTAAACCIGTDAFAAQQIQSLCDRLNALVQDDAVATQHSRAALCLALGAIFRAKAAASGPPPPGAVAAASDALFAVAARPVGVAPLWALQGLLCVAGAAGRGYAPRVRATLQLCQELLVSSAGDTPLLGVAAARLANAMVAVQGPDFSLGSPDYQRIRSLVTDRGALASDGQSLTAAAAGGPAAAAQAVWAALEQVLFAQALILFAPHAVPARKHMPLLLGTLASKRPALRRAAAATLRHLAEREPGVALEEGAEAHLLAALDSERDPQIAEQLRAAVALLLAAGAPAAPGRWLRLLSGVALAAPAAAGGAAAATPRQTGGGGGDRGGSGGFGLASMSLEGDDEDEGPWQGLPSAPPPSAPGGGGGHPHGSGSGSGAAAAPPPAMRTPRLRTRLFAAELLLALFPAVGPDPRHRTPPARNPDERRAPSSSAAALSPAASDALPSATTAAAASDWLVDHLQALVDSGFKLTTGGAEALRPAGARLLRRAVRFFAGVGDPDMPEALLLEQYQAQFVAALRAALTPGGPPALSISGGALATAFIECGLAANDGAVMRRLLDLLVAPLACWRRLAFPQYGEAVSVLARVALLQAHAQCCNIAAAATAGKAVAAAAGGGGGDGRAPAAPAAAVGELCASMVAKAQAPHRGMLCVLWGALLQDQAVITTLPDDPEAAARYRSILFGDASPATATAVAPCYEAAWPAVLAALSSALPPAAELAAARDAEAAAAGGLGDAGVSKTAAAGARDGWGEFVDTVSSSDGDAANAAAWEEQAAARALPVYRFLVNYALAMAAEQAGRAADAFSGGPATAREAGAAAQRAAAAMDALRVLLAPPLLTAGLAPPGTAAEAARMISAACYDALYPMAWSALVTKTGFVTGGGGASAANASPAPDSSPAATTTALIAVSEAAAGVAAALAEGLQAAAWEEDPGLGPALVEALLCLTSVTAPYCLLARGAAGPQFCPAADTGAAAAAAAAAPPPAGLVAAFAASLAAARRLLARRPLVPGTLKPLCEMGVRLLLTAAPGRQLTAAQAFFAEACMPAAAAAGGVEGGAAATAAADTLLAAVGEVLDPGTVSKQGQAGSGRLRLPALLSGLLASAATLCALNPADTTGSSEAVAALGALQRALSPGAPLWAQRAALEALRGTLQDAQADHHHHQQHQQAYGAGRKLLADKAAGAAAPAVAALVHAATRRLAAPLDGDGLAAAAEGLKVLLLVNNLAAARGGDAQAAVLSVLVPLLVQSAAPADGPPTPTLRDMALRLITAMPSAPTGGAAFRTALAALPAASKARLQAALRDSAAAAAAGGGAAAAAGGGARAGALQQPAKPAIQLKTTFALPKS